MHKANLFKSSANLVSNSFIGFVTTILTILVIFNLSWLIIFIRLCTRLSVAANLNKIIFNLESILLLGNLSILILLIGYVVGIRRLKLMLSKKY